MNVGLLVGKSKYHSADKYVQIMNLINEFNSLSNEIFLIASKDSNSTSEKLQGIYHYEIKPLADVNNLDLNFIIVIDPYSHFEVPYSEFKIPIVYKEYGVVGIEPTSGYLIKSQIYKYADLIITESDSYKKKILEQYPSKKVIVGSPAFDFVKDLSPRRKRVKHILWTPRHSIVHKDSYDKILESSYSNFLRDKYFMVNDFMKELPDNIILHIHTHPALKKRYNQLMGSRKAYDDWINQIRVSEFSDRIKIEDKENYYELFDTCDLIINDNVSFIMEWLPTGKPMILVRSKDARYSDYGEELVKRNYTEVTSQEEIITKTLDYIISPEYCKYPRQKDIDKLFIFPGQKNSETLVKILTKMYENSDKVDLT